MNELNTYSNWTDFENVFFEDSFVLNITETPNSIIFQMEVVLLPDHDLYETPKPGEAHCYKDARLEFNNISNLKWVGKNLDFISIDANNETDLGNIDSFYKNESEYFLEGDWGKIVITSDQPKIIYK